MRKVIHGIPKKTIEYMLRLFSPTMDDYPYVLDLKDDSYLISSGLEMGALNVSIYT